MATPSEIAKMWEKDCVVDQTNLGRSSAETPALHGKYISLWTTTQLQLRNAEVDFLKMRKLRTEWYQGTMSKEKLQELEWSPYLKARPLKSELIDLLESDEQMIVKTDAVKVLQIAAEELKHIIGAIKDRGYSIQNAINHQKFMQGN